MNKAWKTGALAAAILLAAILAGCAGGGAGSTRSTEWTAPREPLSEAQLQAIRDNPDVSKIAPAHQRAILALGELGVCPPDAAPGSICADVGVVSEAEGRTVYRCTTERICARDPFPIPCGEGGC
ncbi:MAG: hypothetical protein ACR2RL_09045 [Gammaproteobacteria bacterium]